MGTKSLLCICFVLMAVSILAISYLKYTYMYDKQKLFRVQSDVAEKRLPRPNTIPGGEYNVPRSPLPEENKFTVVMLTHDRDAFLWKALKIYANVSAIDQIILYWNNPGRSPPDFQKDIQFTPEILVISVNLTSLNERFLPRAAIRTQGEKELSLFSRSSLSQSM